MNMKNVKIPNPSHMAENTADNRITLTQEEMERAVEIVSSIIIVKSKCGLDNVEFSDFDVHGWNPVFASWPMIAKVFKDAGYTVRGENNTITW